MMIVDMENLSEEKYIVPKAIERKKFEGRVTRKMSADDREYVQNYYKKEATENNAGDYKLSDELGNEEEQKLHQILYNDLPPKGKVGRIVGWSIPILILAWIVSGFFVGGWDKLVGNALGYVLATGVGATIGSVIAFAHPVTILVGLAGAWLTVLHPVLGIGMFTGLTEAHFRKPKVRDLENLGKDSQSLKGFYKNRFTHILVVIFLSSIGTMLGIFVGIPLFTNTVIPYLTKLMGF